MLAPDTLIQQRYRIVRAIGQGGMGAVYEAIDERLSVTVALKQTLVSDPGALKAFEREAKLLARLQHPAMTTVSDYFTASAGIFLVMQFVPGKDLGRLLSEQDAPFAVETVLDWADQLLAALHFLHTQAPPVIHRDIKPHNLKLTPDGRIMLLDFGLAKGLPATQHASAASGSIFGYTPQYAPLEQIQGSGTTAQSDLYSLAATLYHLLTNQPPDNALTRASALLGQQPDPLRPVHLVNPQVPEAVSTVLTQALSPDANHRPASAEAMRLALRDGCQQLASSPLPAGIAGGMPTRSLTTTPEAPPQPAPRARHWQRHGPIWVVAFSLVLLVAIFVVGTVLLLERQSPTDAPDTAVAEVDRSPEPAGGSAPIAADPSTPTSPPAARTLETVAGQDQPAAGADGRGVLVAVGTRGNLISVLHTTGWVAPTVEMEMKGCLGSGSVFIAPGESAWVGCFRLAASRDRGRTWRPHPINRTAGLALGKISALDPQNRVWWVTDKTITLIDAEDNSILQTFTAPESTGEAGFPSEAIAFHPDGTAWLGGLNINGSALISFDGERWQTYGQPEDLGVQSFESPKALLVNRQGEVLVATGLGLYRMDTATGQLVGLLPASQTRGWSSSPNDLLELPDGTIWVASYGGIGIWDGQTIQRIGRADGLPSNQVRDMALDAAGRVWLATDYGIAVQDGAGGWRVALPSTSGLAESRVGALAVVGAPQLPPETPPKTARVTGRVVLDGAPVAETAVRLCSGTGASSFDEHPCEELAFSTVAQTGGDGVFRLQDVPLGSFELLVFRPNAGWRDIDALTLVDLFRADQEVNLGDIEIGDT